MIGAVRGWHAVVAALPLLVPGAAAAADDPNGAARELAARTVLFAGAGTPVSIDFRNASSLPAADSAQLRAAFENSLRQAGGRLGDAPSPLEVHLTVSENPSQYLLVEEARKGEERQVWIASWKRTQPSLPAATGISLDRRLVWEQDEPILDVAFPNGSMLVLAPAHITLCARRNDHWESRRSLSIVSPRPLPRDPRGRLRITGTRFQAFLPGVVCNGGIDPELTVECRPGDQPWVIESGSHALLLGNFAGARNYFDGRVVAQSGAPKTVPPFYTAAAVEDHGQSLWLLAQLDGRIAVFDSGLSPVSGAPPNLPAWGSDIAGIDSRCGPAAQILATRPVEGEPDAIQSWSLSNRSAAPLTAPVSFPGPVTAVWTSGGSSAVAVARDLATGKYAAYVLTVACGS